MDAHNLVQLQPNPKIPEFGPGDTVNVNTKVKEGDRERIQMFQGVIIVKRGRGPGATFTVRRVSHGVGVERTFLLNSPAIESVEMVRKGSVRRGRLYYLRNLSGKAARIKEKGMTKR